MARVDSQSSASPDVGARSRPSPRPRLGHLGDTGRNDGAEQAGYSMPTGLRSVCWLLQQRGQRRGCAQCAHPGLRIGSYWCRTGPDCGGLRGSGGNSRAGTRFESHLGHVFSLFRGPRASECAQTVHFGPLRGLFLLVCRCCGRRLLLVVRAAVALFTRSWPGVPPAA